MTDMDKMMIEKVARADLRCAVYARALLQMRDMLTAVHDELEDEGDRVYLGSSNHAELIHDAWHFADALHWDEILEDTQPKTPLAEVNLSLQAELKKARAYNPDDRLREALDYCAALPCQTTGNEDAESGCCLTCRARATVSALSPLPQGDG